MFSHGFVEHVTASKIQHGTVVLIMGDYPETTLHSTIKITKCITVNETPNFETINMQLLTVPDINASMMELFVLFFGMSTHTLIKKNAYKQKLYNTLNQIH